MRRACIAPFAFMAILLINGCYKPLELERTVELEAGVTYSFTVDAPKRQEKVSVVVKSPGAPVDVYVVAEKDREEAVKSVEKAQAVKSALASRAKVEDGTLEVTIPAKTEFAIVVHNEGPKKASVTVKATGSQ